MEDISYLFLGENLISELGDEVLLFDKFILKRPDKTTKSFLKLFIEKNYGILTSNSPFLSYSHLDENKEYQLIDNFWVVQHPFETMPWYISSIFALSSLNLTVLLEWQAFRNKPRCLSINALLSKVFYNDYEDQKSKPLIINEQYVNEINFLKKVFNDYLTYNTDYSEIEKTLMDFISLKEISINSPFRFLSYFSILESILTHNKGRSLSNSSITFQLQNKLNLLNRRFDTPINFNNYFKVPDTVNFELIIEKLYQYRSDIAHGNNSDFDKDLFILKGRFRAAMLFIHELTRKVIIQTLLEPRLVKDLKEC